MKIINLFDVKSNLHKNTYKPYRKSEKQSVKGYIWVKPPSRNIKTQDEMVQSTLLSQ